MDKASGYEIVRVASPFFLVSSRHQACRYETSDGKPLADGFYLARQKARRASTFYGRDQRYFGPFGSKAEARMLQTSALALGLVMPATTVEWSTRNDFQPRQHANDQYSNHPHLGDQYPNVQRRSPGAEARREQRL